MTNKRRYPSKLGATKLFIVPMPMKFAHSMFGQWRPFSLQPMMAPLCLIAMVACSPTDTSKGQERQGRETPANLKHGPAAPLTSDPNWHEIGTMGYRPSGPRSTFMVETTSIRRSDQLVRYWVRQRYEEPVGEWAGTTTLEEIDCSEGKIRILQQTSDHVDPANLEAPDTQPPDPWSYIEPGTSDAAVFEYVCLDRD